MTLQGCPGPTGAPPSACSRGSGDRESYGSQGSSGEPRSADGSRCAPARRLRAPPFLERRAPDLPSARPRRPLRTTSSDSWPQTECPTVQNPTDPRNPQRGAGLQAQGHPEQSQHGPRREAAGDAEAPEAAKVQPPQGRIRRSTTRYRAPCGAYRYRAPRGA
eukprot:gene15308-biopygen12649